MPATAINWREDPLTRIPTSRARLRGGQLHSQTCTCAPCRKILATARAILERGIRTFQVALKHTRPAEILLRAETKTNALYAVWFEMRRKYIAGVRNGTIDHPPQRNEAPRRRTAYSVLCENCNHLAPCHLVKEGLGATATVRENCVLCGHQHNLETVRSLQGLLARGPTHFVLDAMAAEAVRHGLIKRPSPRRGHYVEPYRPPPRIAKRTAEVTHAKAMIRKAQENQRKGHEQNV